MPPKSTYANRGKELERYINQANERYELLDVALINKNEPPVVVVKLEKKRVTDGFFSDKGLPDYTGIAKGKSIAFEAKETEKVDKFPLKNVQDHQVEYLRKHMIHGGKSFLIIRFVKQDEVYLLDFDHFLVWWDTAKQNRGKKNIPYDFFLEKASLCKPGRNLAIDYLASLGM